VNRQLLLFNAVLLASFGALWWLDRRLESEREARRAADSAFHTIADSTTPPVANVARIELLLPGSQTRWILEKRPEGWRLPQYRDAYATAPEIDGLLKSFLESHGTVVGMLSDAEAAKHFGFVPGQVIEITLFGASSNQLLKATAGSVAPGQRSGECFLAADGLDRILHANANPWPYVPWDPTSRFPPLTDRKVLPSALGHGSAARIVFGGETAPAVRELIRREIPKERLGPMMDRGPRFEWFGLFADGEKRVNDNAAYTYLSGVTGLQFDELLGGLAEREAQFARPGLTITLENDGGTKDTLALGGQDDKGFRYLSNGTTQQAFLITPAKAATLTPNLEALMAPQPQPPAPPPQPPPQVPVPVPK